MVTEPAAPEKDGKKAQSRNADEGPPLAYADPGTRRAEALRPLHGHLSFALSFGLHVLVIAALLYIRVDFSKPRLPPGAISVSLVLAARSRAGAGPAGRRRRPAGRSRQAGRKRPSRRPKSRLVSVAAPAPKPVP
ncbi:MAG: hypothetical protein MZV70_63140 [Desulfobacterales bacterium]|nr:hypothetical protein [Desulfobacterales bacterium]